MRTGERPLEVAAPLEEVRADRATILTGCVTPKLLGTDAGGDGCSIPQSSPLVGSTSSPSASGSGSSIGVTMPR